MCEVTKEIERHPESQRRLLEIRRICERLTEAVREALHGKEPPDGKAAHV